MRAARDRPAALLSALTDSSSAYFGPFVAITLPLPILVACDLPIRRPIFFQAWLTVAVWYCGWVRARSTCRG